MPIEEVQTNIFFVSDLSFSLKLVYFRRFEFRRLIFLTSVRIPVISAFDNLGPRDLGRSSVISPGDLAR